MLPPNPFNPGSPVDPGDFVGRSKDLENFRQKLRQTADGSLASMSVAGGYGIGKTSFLHKCRVIAEEQQALVVLFSLNEMDKLDRRTLAAMLIGRMKEKVNEEVILKRIQDRVLHALQKVKITTTIAEVEVQAELSPSGNSLFPNLQSALKASWKTLQESKKAIVFLIDEARVLEKNRADLVLYLRAILEQLQVSKIPVMIVPAGKLTITGPSGTGFSPLVRTFPPAILENFSSEESRLFIEKKLEKTSFKVHNEVIKKVYEETEGHPFVLTAYMAGAYSKLQEGDTTLSLAHFEALDIDFVKVHLAPFFARFYDQAGKNSKQILWTIAAQGGEVVLSQLTSDLNKNSNEISPHLGKLVQEGAIIRTERGKYRLFHHLLGKYIKNRERRE